MADFITCANQFDLPTIFRAIMANQAAGGALTGFRIAIYVGEEVEDWCNVSSGTFTDLLRACIRMETDGLPTLRLGYLETPYPLNCIDPSDTEALMKRAFCETSDGMALAVFITAPVVPN